MFKRKNMIVYGAGQIKALENILELEGSKIHFPKNTITVKSR